MATKQIFLWFSLLITLTASIPIIENGSNTTEIMETREEMMNRYRLPNNTLPRLYKINIAPNVNYLNFGWSGESSIDFEVLENTKIVTLHAYKNLVIDESFTKLVDVDGNEYRPIGQTRDDILEFLKIEFEEELLIGNYTLNLKYEGEDTRQIRGFYYAARPDSSVPKVAATHFEATTARRAFPCWDEPGLKARFQLSIKHDSKFTAISNMPEIESVETPDGKILTKFHTTPIMSTYLLTFVIAEYESLTNEHGNVTIWADKNIIEEVRHVLNTSQKVVDVMENYTGLPYEFPRIGSVLVPIYSAAATEHWGLVTYSESLMRFNETISSTAKLEGINLLIAHELAHSWFGNRVSPLWWNDLWLNEAFAAYFQYVIMDEIYENWGGTQLFILQNNQERSFILDTYDDNVPVRYTPVSNTEIRRVFGQITYRKGSSIVHMFRNVLGDDVFHAGLKKFLTNRSFKAAEASDLIEAFQETYDENENTNNPLNVNETMMSWLMQTGYPIVNVTRNYTNGDTVVNQNSVIIGDSLEKKWWIPLNYATKTNPNFSSTKPSSWISDQENAVTITGIDANDWVIFNVQASGYYRVNYDDENWKRIIEYLNTDDYKNIHVINRAQLINDVGFLAQREPLRYETKFWQLIKYLWREVDYLPWKAAQTVYQPLEYTLSYTKARETFHKYIMGMMNSLIEKVGYEALEDQDHLEILSNDIVYWACMSGHSGCADYSAKRLLQMIENPVDNRLYPDNLDHIFCAGLRGLNNTAIQEVVEWALSNDLTTMLLLRSLGCTQDHEIHKNILLGTLEVNVTYASSMNMAFSNMLGSEENFNFAIDFFIENHQAINNFYRSRGWDDPTEDLVRMILPSIQSRARLEKFKKVLDLNIFKDLTPSTLLQEAEDAVANTDINVAKFQTLWDEQLSPDNSVI